MEETIRKQESDTMARLNKILKCRHIFDSEQGSIPTELLLVCRECFLNAKVEVVSYADHK